VRLLGEQGALQVPQTTQNPKKKPFECSAYEQKAGAPRNPSWAPNLDGLFSLALNSDGAPEVLTSTCENGESTSDSYWTLTPKVHKVLQH
jgi:hypothetical protein